MKKYINILLGVIAVLVVTSCSKESLFGDPSTIGTGRFYSSALDISLANENGPRDVHGRRVPKAAPAVNDFTVEFFRNGEETPRESFKYSEMPEVITLPAGDYVVRASYGDNPSASWEAPYYKGETTFTLVPDDIVDDVEPIVCRFCNVRVSITFDSALMEAMSSDSKVTVKVGESGYLDFTAADMERSGYFAYVEDSHTLAATFTGSIGGAPSSETKVYDNVQPGSHYKITFRLHDAGDEDPGDINVGGITVDASVITDDMNVDVESGESNIEDDLRPKEDEEPITPPDPGKEAPSITAQAPLDIDKVNDVREKDTVILNVESFADGGITGFVVVIDSPILTPDELESVGLSDRLDLVNPGQYEQQLLHLGLPVNVGGKSEVKFDISGFIGLLNLLGEGSHNFIVTVSDANGTTTRTLRLHNIP